MIKTPAGQLAKEVKRHGAGRVKLTIRAVTGVIP
jgi:hypothetical protein